MNALSRRYKRGAPARVSRGAAVHRPTPREGARARPAAQRLPRQGGSARAGQSWYGPLFNALLVLLLLASALCVAVILFLTGDTLLPGAGSLGIEVGGLSRVEAGQRLAERWDEQRIVLDLGNGARREVAPAVLGVTLDVETTTLALHQQGRTWESVAALLDGGEVPAVEPIYRFDPGTAAANLAEMAGEFAIAPVEPSVRIVEGRAVPTAPVAGQRLDVEATVAGLAERLGQVLAGEPLALAMAPVAPAAADMDVNAVVEQVNRLLAAPLTFQLYDPIADQTHTWVVPAQEWGGWLALDLHPVDGSLFRWAMDPAAVKGYLDAQSASLGTGQYVMFDRAVAGASGAVSDGSYATELRIYHEDRKHVVQPGETFSSIAWQYGIPYPWIQQANPGVAENLWAGQELVIPSPDRLLPLPVVRNKRVVVSIGQQRMWAYENGGLRWEWPVSTGIADSPTAPGVFQVQSHQPNAYAGQWDLWMPYFMGIYEPAPGGDFMNGFHGFPTRGGHTLFWTEDLGHPVTFGCILLSTENAALLYDWAEEGVIVEVRA